MKRCPVLVALLAPLSLLLIVALVAAAPVERAQGAFPGENGRIAFAQGAIKTIRPDGSKVRRVTRPKDSQADSQPVFSPSGKRIAFVRDFYGGPRRNERSRIFITRKDGSHAHKLERRRPPLRFYRGPAFSPGGTWIVFQGCRTHRQCAVFTIKTDGTRQRRLTDYAPNYQPIISTHAFSPNGRMIAFDGYRGGACDIYLMRADGSDLHGLTNNERGECDYRPSFSPDGSEITFISSDHCTNPGFVQPQICVMRADGTDVRPLTGSENFGVLDYSFSPNGRRIAFVYLDSLGDAYGLWVMRPDGTDEHELVVGSDPDWGVR